MTAVPAEQPEVPDVPPVPRTRDDVVADLDRLIEELDAIDNSEDPADWILLDWMAVEVWGKPDGGEAVTIGRRREPMSMWRARGMLAEALRWLG